MTPDCYDRLVDELALVLCSVPDLDRDDTCMQALAEAGYRGSGVICILPEARQIARDVRVSEIDLWHKLMAPLSRCAD